MLLARPCGRCSSWSQTQLSSIIHIHVACMFAAGDSALLWFNGRKVSSAGAALANGMTIDAIDAHDGDPLGKGHMGCGLLPGLVAFTQNVPHISGHQFLRLRVAGYEIGSHAGISLHASTRDYHTSGAWIAPAVAIMGAHMLGLDEKATRHVAGIAEYHGPHSQMMRGVDHPTMVKEGSGWGAMAGVFACYMTRAGFTGTHHR